MSRVLHRTTFSGRLIRLDEDAETANKTRNILKAIICMIVDISVVLVVTCALFFWFQGKGISPYEREVPCSDETISHPFYPNTVGLKHLLFVSLASPFFIILIVEGLLFLYSKGENKVVNFFFVSTITYLQYLLVYAACTFAMEFLKCYIGRLRPHFYSVCMPDLSAVNCTDPSNFIKPEQLVCTNPDKRRIRTARTSFPSGHTAAAVHVFLFVMLYLYRMAKNTKVDQIKMARNILVPLYFIWTSFTAISRVTDYWHHVTDVYGGIVLACIFVLPAFYRSWTVREEIYVSRRLFNPVKSK